jgi:serine/threonine protein kinase
MNFAENCLRCGAPVSNSKLGGLCSSCLKKSVAIGLEDFDDELTPLSAEASAPKPTPFAIEDRSYDALGQTIGRYKLREKIGEGGGGVVYVAEQTEPVRRRVALKLIKLGMDTKQVVARFEAERQALALMDHPNIAKVLDAGATESGRPYFVMELVPGIKITDFCDENQLNTRERLKLFIKVCQAIQHAHQKGIIHRDIKPSNVLVTLHDDQAVPKVIDFGIAKATEGRLSARADSRRSCAAAAGRSRPSDCPWPRTAPRPDSPRTS